MAGPQARSHSSSASRLLWLPCLPAPRMGTIAGLALRQPTLVRKCMMPTARTVSYSLLRGTVLPECPSIQGKPMLPVKRHATALPPTELSKNCPNHTPSPQSVNRLFHAQIQLDNSPHSPSIPDFSYHPIFGNILGHYQIPIPCQSFLSSRLPSLHGRLSMCERSVNYINALSESGGV